MSDLLKSVKNVNTAIRLFHDVVSNQIKVHHSVPEKDRRIGLKDVYLNSDTNFPTEKSLAVNWDIGCDRLGFKLNLDSKRTTRCRCYQ